MKEALELRASGGRVPHQLVAFNEQNYRTADAVRKQTKLPSYQSRQFRPVLGEPPLRFVCFCCCAFFAFCGGGAGV